MSDDELHDTQDAELLQWILSDRDAMAKTYCEVAELDMPLRRPGSDHDPQDAKDWSRLEQLHRAWRQPHRTPSDRVGILAGLGLTVAQMRRRVGLETWLPG